MVNIDSRFTSNHSGARVVKASITNIIATICFLVNIAVFVYLCINVPESIGMAGEKMDFIGKLFAEKFLAMAIIIIAFVATYVLSALTRRLHHYIVGWRYLMATNTILLLTELVILLVYAL